MAERIDQAIVDFVQTEAFKALPGGVYIILKRPDQPFPGIQSLICVPERGVTFKDALDAAKGVLIGEGAEPEPVCGS